MRLALVAMAVVLAIIPLLPKGPNYLGLDGANGIDAAVVLMTGLWLIVRFTSRRRRMPANSDAIVGYIWALFVVIGLGAMLIGLARENRLGSPVLEEWLPEVRSRILAPGGLTSDPFISARIWLTFLEGWLTYAVVRDCCLRAVDSRQFVRLASWGWLAAMGAVSLFAIFQYLTRFQLHPYWVRVNPDLVRAHATLDDPNMLGTYLLLGLGLAIGIALSEPRTVLKRIATALGGLACLGLFTTGSRVAWAGLLVTSIGLISLGFTKHVRGLDSASLQRLGRWLLGGTAALVITLLLARLVVSERPLAAERPANALQVITQTLDPRVPLREVFKDRLEYWSAALRMAGDSPATGVGLGLFPRRLPEFRALWVPPENAHNFYLQVLAEAGVGGLTALLALMGMSCAVLIRAVRNQPPADAGRALGGLFGIAAFAMTLIASHALLLPSGQVLFGAALALALAGSGQPRLLSSAATPRAVVALTAVTILGAFLIAARNVPSPPRDAVWGSSWGYYEEEGGFFPTSFALPPDHEDPGVPAPSATRWARFRWTGTRSVLELQTPEHAIACVLPFAATLPSHGSPQHVSISYGDAPIVIPVRDSDLNSVRIALNPRLLDAERRLVVRIHVSPAFVPANLGLSVDRRQLGVVMFRPRCS